MIGVDVHLYICMYICIYVCDNDTYHITPVCTRACRVITPTEDSLQIPFAYTPTILIKVSSMLVDVVDCGLW